MQTFLTDGACSTFLLTSYPIALYSRSFSSLDNLSSHDCVLTGDEITISPTSAIFSFQIKLLKHTTLPVLGASSNTSRHFGLVKEFLGSFSMWNTEVDYSLNSQVSRRFIAMNSFTLYNRCHLDIFT